MLNQGAYIWPGVIGLYLTNALVPAISSVYICHCKFFGSEPYTTVFALFKSPYSLWTLKPIFSSSEAISWPIDSFGTSSCLMSNFMVMGLPLNVHFPPSFVAPAPSKGPEIMCAAREGLYLKPKDSTTSITFRYSGEYTPKGPLRGLP